MLILNFEKLFQIIKSLIQLTDFNIVFIEIIRLLHINILLNIVIKKTILMFIYFTF